MENRRTISVCRKNKKKNCMAEKALFGYFRYRCCGCGTAAKQNFLLYF